MATTPPGALFVYQAKEKVMTSTCMVCLSDFDNESMIEDITGAKYCLLDSGEICLVCGIYGHDCEGK